MSDNTKYGHLVTHADEDDDEPDVDVRPVVETTRHAVSIDDNRDGHGYEYGLEWMFFVEDGIIQGIYCGHYLEGRTQSDPMRVTWDDVPEVVRTRLERELNIDTGDLENHLELPDHQRGGRGE